MSNKPQCVGIDFGTFKTSIVASNGNRDSIMTAVGLPKDHIARGMLGCDEVFGDRIGQVRTAVNLVRPFDCGALKYTDSSAAGLSADEVNRRCKAAKSIMGEVVRRVELGTGPRYAVIGAPSQASDEAKNVILQAASPHFDAVRIVAEPFCIAYGFGHLVGTLVVDIGAGTIDVCPMFGTYPKPDQQYSASVGGDAVDRELLSLIQQAHPDAQVTLNMARQFKEKFGTVSDDQERAVVVMPVEGVPTEFDITDIIRDACRVLVEPIIEGIHKTVAMSDPEFQAQLRGNILLGGGGSQLRGLDRRLETGVEKLGGGKVTRVNDCLYAGAAGALKLCMAMPAENWEQLRSQNAKAA